MSVADVESYISSAAGEQQRRMSDVYLLGPFLLFLAFKSKKGPLGKWQRRALFVAGAYTIVYNYSEYKKITNLDFSTITDSTSTNTTS